LSAPAESGADIVDQEALTVRHQARRFAVFAVLALIPIASAGASGGDLDPSFGTGGTVVTDFGFGENAHAVVLQPDGKVVLVGFGFVSGTGFDYELARYDEAGALDPTFGSGGRVATDFGGTFDQAFAAAIQPDGKIVAAGLQAGSNVAFSVARYGQDGSLDAGFGNGGRVVTDIGDGYDQVFALAMQPDGKILAAGVTGLDSFNGQVGDFALARYEADGSLDPGFGNGGVVILDFEGSLNSHDIAYAVDVLPNGKILAGGLAGVQSGGLFHKRGFALARFDVDGTLDEAFGAGGKVVTEFGLENAIAYDLVVGPDLSITAAGTTNQFGVGADFAVARYLPDGALDASFGTGGRVTTDFIGNGDEARSVSLQSDGKLVVAGFAGLIEPVFGGVDNDWAVVRYKADGTLDGSFGSAGKVTTAFANGHDVANGLAIRANGKLVVGGIAHMPSTFDDFAVAQYLASEPSADEQLAALIALVESYDLRMLGSSLTDKLTSVQRLLERGKTAQACANLEGFLNQVSAQRGKGLTAAQADALISAGERVGSTLGC
jgi:uncharacterized delta-60 repeat protein